MRTWGLHSVTNLIPSTVLHRAALPGVVAAPYRALRFLDRAMGRTRLARALSNSLVVLATKA